MLINDGIANEAQSGCHMEIAYAVRFPARSLYQHCFAHHRCTGGGAGDQAAASVNVPKHRSEEHTSELQSLMRISYAVFCLKKNTHQHILQRPETKHLHRHLINTSHSCLNTSAYTYTYLRIAVTVT